MSGRRKRKAVERTEVVEEGTNPNHAECSAGGWEDGWENEGLLCRASLPMGLSRQECWSG